MKKGDHLFLVDGSAYIFRAYHALPPLTRKSDGLPIGAVSGFCNMLWKLLQEARDTSVGVTPTHFAVIFDHSSTTFRNEIYPEYKANRDAPPEDLRPQFAIIREATRAFDVPCIEKEGYEADDIIASYAREAVAAGGDVTIISSDKDLMQLINDNVIMYDTMKDKRVASAEVIEKFGVGPEKMIDLQSLAGDSTDNIPGVPGIGPKTAAQLLEEFGDLETLLERAGEIKQNKRRENLIEFADQARLSKRLVTLDVNTPLDVPVEDLALNSVDGPKLIAFLKGLELNTLTRRVAAETEADAAAIDASEISADGYEQRGPDFDAPAESASTEGGSTPSGLVEKVTAAMAAMPVDTSAYETVRDEAALQSWIDAAHEAGVVAVDTETDSLDAMQAQLVGVSLAVAPGKACYIPLGHMSGEGDMFGGGLVADQIDRNRALEMLKPLLEDASVLKIAQNMKYDWLLLSRPENGGIHIAPFDDTMLLSYVLDAGRTKHGMDALSEAILGHTPISYKDVAGTGKSAVSFAQVEIDKATAYAAEDADITLRLWKILKARLTAEGMNTVYERLERPLVPVICRMEARGISVDRQILSRLSGELAQKAAAIESEIYELAGRKFNVGSPKQLGEILFDEMNLPGGKKTKTGQWATGAQQLEDLAAEGHDLPRKIVDWRQLSKLKSTYTDALPGFINPQTKRVHTSYAMASTSTGRLSSSDPNLQNIPVRTEEGRKIRTAFVAEPGFKLVSADYSQIELRVLAHVADIPQLKQAFADGIDIHAMTASEMFNVPVEGMDPMIRRQAKAINFGIIYGISAFGLANNLGIGRSEAGDYIKMYFERFPGIRDYMDSTKKFAKEHGFVETIFGRKAHYEEIRSSNPQVRAFNERAAINAPIQGSAADIIRRAMVQMEGALGEAKLNAEMLLQVHDELIFEVPEAEVDETITLVTKIMENATMPVMQLSVPLQVDARAADNWDEAH
ncbi:DNA polymerase I [Pseudahrensia aquimaris]|uniref:DNA polymerase I n=1 Tax=Pseudahrensia aquimaris TaxID=744461 RepID=A0ABW3FEU0_9HYPH